MCALLGVFILTLPLPIVVNSFSAIYKNRFASSFLKALLRLEPHNTRLWRNEVAQKKAETMKALAATRNNSEYDEHIRRKLSSVHMK